MHARTSLFFSLPLLLAVGCASEQAPAEAPTAPVVTDAPAGATATAKVATATAAPDITDASRAGSSPTSRMAEELQPPPVADPVLRGSIDFLLDFVALVDASRSNCDELGRGMDQLLDKYADRLRQLKAREDRMTHEERDAEAAPFTDFFKRVGVRTDPIIARCRETPWSRQRSPSSPTDWSCGCRHESEASGLLANQREQGRALQGLGPVASILGELAIGDQPIGGEEELVQLRRLDVGAGEHRVDLTAVVDLVDEEVGEDVLRLVLVWAVLAIERDRLVQVLLGELALAEGDQALVHRLLRRQEGVDGGVLLLVGEDVAALACLLEPVDVELVDDPEVLEGDEEPGKEADPLGVDRLRIKQLARSIQPEVGPRVVPRHLDEVLVEGHLDGFVIVRGGKEKMSAKKEEKEEKEEKLEQGLPTLVVLGATRLRAPVPPKSLRSGREKRRSRFSALGVACAC